MQIFFVTITSFLLRQIVLKLTNKTTVSNSSRLKHPGLTSSLLSLCSFLILYILWWGVAGGEITSVSKMLAECRQTSSRFDQKMSTNWHQLCSVSVLSIRSVYIIKQQIGSRNRADSVLCVYLSYNVITTEKSLKMWCFYSFVFLRIIFLNVISKK